MKASKILDKSYFWVDVVRMHYYFIDSRKRFDKVMRHLGATSRAGNTNGKCVQLEKGTQTMVVIGVFNGEDSTLVHECVHAGLFTLDSMGQKLSYNDELLPYLTDTIFSKCKAIYA